MKRCDWPPGCEEWAASEELVCGYHQRVLDGLITTPLSDPHEEELACQRKKMKIALKESSRSKLRLPSTRGEKASDQPSSLKPQSSCVPTSVVSVA